jgi:hypothetical protein
MSIFTCRSPTKVFSDATSKPHRSVSAHSKNDQIRMRHCARTPRGRSTWGKRWLFIPGPVRGSHFHYSEIRDQRRYTIYTMPCHATLLYSPARNTQNTYTYTSGAYPPVAIILDPTKRVVAVDPLRGFPGRQTRYRRN